MKPRTPRTLVRAVPYCHGEVLLLQRSEDERWRPSQWHLPAGGVEEFEDPDHAVRRELFEEAGLVSGLIQVVGTSIFHIEGPEMHEDWVNINYLIAVDKTALTLPDEIQASKWVPLEKAVKDPSLPWADRKAMLQALQIRENLDAILGE